MNETTIPTNQNQNKGIKPISKIKNFFYMTAFSFFSILFGIFAGFLSGIFLPFYIPITMIKTYANKDRE